MAPKKACCHARFRQIRTNTSTYLSRAGQLDESEAHPQRHDLHLQAAEGRLFALVLWETALCGSSRSDLPQLAPTRNSRRQSINVSFSSRVLHVFFPINPPLCD